MRLHGERVRLVAPAVTFLMAGLVASGLAFTAACTNAEPDAPRQHRIAIRAFQYVPARLTVAAGDTVVWINEDAVPHTATAGDGRWDTGGIGAQQSGQIVAGETGEYPYVCAFHLNMTGTLVVE